jgi:hypothetical protein
VQAVKFRSGQGAAQPPEIGIPSVGQSDRPAGEHSRGHPRLAQTAFGNRHQVEAVGAEQSRHRLRIPAYGIDVYEQFRHRL